MVQMFFTQANEDCQETENLVFLLFLTKNEAIEQNHAAPDRGKWISGVN